MAEGKIFSRNLPRPFVVLRKYEVARSDLEKGKRLLKDIFLPHCTNDWGSLFVATVF
jgi:hypothetical protein